MLPLFRKSSHTQPVRQGATIIDKRAANLRDAIEGVAAGSTVLVGGFGEVGSPAGLLAALLDLGVGDLTIVANNAGVGEDGLAGLFRSGQVRRVICSYPRSKGSVWFERRYSAGEVQLELVPQGTLSERIRAGGAGIGAFFTPTGAGSELAEGKEVRTIDGRPQILEMALPGDVALIKAHRADRLGNLTYRASARNYNPTMAMAGALTLVEADHLVEVGAIDPEDVITPGIFVDRVVATGTDR
jgi:3-oxoadipate CoA-transferase alpha subunit